AASLLAAGDGARIYFVRRGVHRGGGRSAARVQRRRGARTLCALPPHVPARARLRPRRAGAGAARFSRGVGAGGERRRSIAGAGSYDQGRCATLILDRSGVGIGGGGRERRHEARGGTAEGGG